MYSTSNEQIAKDRQEAQISRLADTVIAIVAPEREKTVVPISPSILTREAHDSDFWEAVAREVHRVFASQALPEAHQTTRWWMVYQPGDNLLVGSLRAT